MSAGELGTEHPELVPDPNAARALRTRRRRNWLLRKGADYGVLVALLVMIVGFSVALPTTFPTLVDAQQILGSQAIPGILALAVIIPLAAGVFDLSVGATLGFASVFSAHYAGSVPIVPLFLLTVCLGVVIGSINAGLVWIGVNPFIATLGVATILSGGNEWVTQDVDIYQGIGPSFTSIAQDHFLGLELPVFYFLGLALVLYYLLEWTPYGRYLRATGLGREAARLTGVRTQLWLGSSFIAAGAIAAAAGFLETAYVASASPSIGPEFLLPAYASAFLGTTTIVRGFFNVWGTVVGVFLLAVGTTGLVLGGAPFWIEPVFNGAALIVAVTLAVLGARAHEARGS
jgi:ribose transport system permease protein